MFWGTIKGKSREVNGQYQKTGEVIEAGQMIGHEPKNKLLLEQYLISVK